MYCRLKGGLNKTFYGIYHSSFISSKQTNIIDGVTRQIKPTFYYRVAQLLGKHGLAQVCRITIQILTTKKSEISLSFRISERNAADLQIKKGVFPYYIQHINYRQIRNIHFCWVGGGADFTVFRVIIFWERRYLPILLFIYFYLF